MKYIIFKQKADGQSLRCPITARLITTKDGRTRRNSKSQILKVICIETTVVGNTQQEKCKVQAHIGQYYIGCNHRV